MILTEDQIREKIKSPNQQIADELRRAELHDQRCEFHTIPEDSPSRITYLQKHLGWVENLLVGDKFEVYKHLMTLPIKTVEITNGILDELKKVFETQDRFEKIDFSSPELIQDSIEYSRKIGLKDYFKSDGFQLMKSRINSFLIIDLPEVQEGNFPEPYFYRLCPTDVIETMVKMDSTLEYIIFKGDNKVIFCFDEKSFWKFNDDGKEFTLISRIDHNLGRVPAMTFWKEKYNNNSIVQKQGPVSKSTGWLDLLLTKLTFGDHLEMYAGFPVMMAYEQKCTYQDENTLATCDGFGVLAWVDSFSNQQKAKCPACEKRKNFFGPGTLAFAPAPSTKEDADLIVNGFKMVTPEVSILEWMSKSSSDRISWITWNMIGVPDEVTSMAINEKQVVTQFESRVNVLNNIRDNFERSEQYLKETIFMLRYGKAFQKLTLKYGEEYFLYTASQKRKEYEEAKKNGSSMYELSSLRHQLIEAKAKNNPDLKQRLYLLSWLEPYVDMTLSELKDLSQSVAISEDLIKLKAGFDGYISRFEREQGSIVAFMAKVDLAQKIDYIKDTLLSYVEEENPEEDPTGLPPVNEDES